MRFPRSLLLVPCGLALLASQDPPLDREGLETVEERTETLANRLLDLSVAVRRQDLAGMSLFLAERLEGNPMPERALPPEPVVKWISDHGWETTEPREMGREEVLRSWEAFLRHFSEVEDVRFKVKASTIASDGLSAEASIGFFLVGRDDSGRREWVRTTGEARARKVEGGDWILERLRLEAPRSRVSAEDLFSEVSVPAGISRKDAPFFEQPGAGYLWRGAAGGDVDGDSRLDLFVVGVRENHLYRNEGNGRFGDVAGDALVRTFPRHGVQPLLLDTDGDGDLDLFVSADGPQMLFENRLVPDGRLEFWDVSARAGVAVPAVGFSAVAGDVNGDGAPDVYVCSYNRYGTVLPDDWSNATNGTPNLLFVSRGDGTFEEAAGRWGVADARWSYAAAFADVDEDGDLDLYVANDYGENALYLREGPRFVDAARERGALDPGNGMGVSFGDFDNDGDLDLHVTNMSSTAGNRILGRLRPEATRDESVLKKLASGNTLLENLGGGRFRDVTERAGPFSAGWAWGGGFFDLDGDGWEDLYTPNGFLSGPSMADT